MSTYTYTKSVGKISSLFSSIMNKGVPAKVTVQWLKSIGFTSSNDATLIPLLKSLKFVDDSGAPTEYWSKYRSPKGPQVLAEAIRNAYDDLFSTHPDAQSLDDQQLMVFFRANTKSGEDTVRRTVSTFNELAKLADFGTNKNLRPDHLAGNANATPEPEPNLNLFKSPSLDARSLTNAGQPLTINLNVELQIPATDDQSVYEAFFAAMKKHLLSGGN